jgi:hypothetical protein
LNIIGDQLIKSDEDAVHMFEFYDKKHGLVFPVLLLMRLFGVSFVTANRGIRVSPRAFSDEQRPPGRLVL